MPPIHVPIDLRSPSPDSDISELVSTAATGYPSRQSSAGPARPRRRRAPHTAPNENDVIEVDDSDDEVEIVGSAGPRRLITPTATAASRSNSGQVTPRISQSDFDQSLAELDAALARRGRALAELDRLDSFASRSQTHTPPVGGRAGGPEEPPRGTPPRIALGGAVYRRGNQEVRFAPGQRPQRVRFQRNGDQEIDPPQPTRTRDFRWPRDINNPDFDPDFDPLDFEDDEDGEFLPDGNPDVRGRLRPRWAVGPGPLGLAPYLRGGSGVIAQMLHGFGDGRYLERAFNIVPGLMPPAMGRAGPGPARFGQEDIATILAKVEAPVIPPAPPGFTHTWDAEELVKEDKERTVIQLDEEGAVMPVSKRKPYLACAACPEPLRVSAAERTPEDRVWALRCGHVLDQRCFQGVAWGPEEDEGDGSAPKAKRRKKSKPQVREYAWTCPVAGCGREHVSKFEDGRWTPKEGAGGIQVYI